MCLQIFLTSDKRITQILNFEISRHFTFRFTYFFGCVYKFFPISQHFVSRSTKRASLNKLDSEEKIIYKHPDFRRSNRSRNFTASHNKTLDHHLQPWSSAKTRKQIIVAASSSQIEPQKYHKRQGS